MPDLVIASIAYNAPWAIEEQIRLFKKYVTDRHQLVVFDNSPDTRATIEIADLCKAARVTRYRLNVKDCAHHLALDVAADVLVNYRDESYFGFVDHDVFPVRETALIPMIEEAGFLTVGQRHAPTGRFYGWPGFLFMSREWLDGRPLDFSGIRAVNKRDDGDTGSMNWPLFVDASWDLMYRLDHGYRAIREPDSVGLQSWGVETIGDFVHASNTSRWMAVPEPEERERLVREMLAAL